MTLGRLVRFPVASVGYSCLGTLGMRLAVSAGSARIRLLLPCKTRVEAKEADGSF